MNEFGDREVGESQGSLSMFSGSETSSELCNRCIV